MPDERSVQRRFSRVLHKYKPLSVLAAAFLTVLVVMVLARLPESSAILKLTEQNGVYDLSGIGDMDGAQLLLAPPETYYPDFYLTPENADTAAPESTRRYGKIRSEYLSQRFILVLPDNSDIYTLTFKLSGRHAIRVYVNGSLAGQTGTPGTTKQDTEVWENNITVRGAAKNGKMDVILNSAQFYHAKRGASLAEIRLSRQNGAAGPFDADRIKGLLVMGTLSGAAISLLGIYFLLARTKVTLYFALACVTMALRESLQSQAWTYFPIPGNLSFMLEYLSMVLLTVFLTLYLGQYALGKPMKGIEAAALTGSGIYGLCVLFGDSLFYTSILKYYQLLLILCIIPGIAGVFRNLSRPTGEQIAALYGISVFFLSAVADILMYLDVFGATETKPPVSGGTMLIFALAEVFSLYLMNNRVLAESKEAEQKLEAEKTALESLDKMKTEFLGNVSHELKTPLTVMSGYAQTTKQLAERSEHSESGEISRRMTLISSEAERLSLMVGQILDVTRMEEGRMVMEPVCCHLDEIIHSAVKTHYPILNKNQNRLKIQIEGGLPDLFADPGRISQVIVNLISNAVRFTVKGEITISAKQWENQLLVCVSDTGTGMDRERLENLFNRYSKKQKSGGGQDTGTGLGLYICRHIVEQHGGRIWLESEEDKGTSVFFTLPAADANSGPC